MGKLALTTGFAIALAGCALAQRPETWVRVDHTHADPSAVAAASADCRAQAQLIGSQRGALRPVILAQFDPHVTPPSDYSGPLVDFSPLGDVGRSLGQQIERNRLIQSVMEGCMAQKGYIRAS